MRLYVELHAKMAAGAQVPCKNGEDIMIFLSWHDRMAFTCVKGAALVSLLPYDGILAGDYVTPCRGE